MSGVLEKAIEELIEDRIGKRLSYPVRLDADQLEQLGTFVRDELRTLHLRGAGPEQRMTAEDVCLYLGISRRTLERRIQHGEAPPARVIGGTKMWTKRTLDAYLG